MFERFTEKAINIISMAQKEAADSKTFKIYPEHILLGVLETKSNICSRLLAYGGMNADDFREYVYKKYSDVSHEFMHTNIAFSEGSQKLIKLASELAKKKNSYIMSEHILLALILTAESAKSELLQDFNRYGVDIEKLKQTLLKLIEKITKRMKSNPDAGKKKR